MSNAQTVICTYHVKPGKEAEFQRILAKHWPALHKAGLVTDDRPLHYKGLKSDRPDKHGGDERTFVEIYAWKDEQASGKAHQSPEIMAVWEPMGALCDRMSFPHFEPLKL